MPAGSLPAARSMRIVAALKASILAGLGRAGYVLLKRDAYCAEPRRMAELEAAHAAEKRRADALDAAVAVERLRADAGEAAVAAARLQARELESTIAAEVCNARLATAHAERQLEQARAELWAARHAPAREAGGTDADPSRPRDRGAA